MKDKEVVSSWVLWHPEEGTYIESLHHGEGGWGPSHLPTEDIFRALHFRTEELAQKFSEEVGQRWVDVGFTPLHITTTTEITIRTTK